MTFIFGLEDYGRYNNKMVVIIKQGGCKLGFHCKFVSFLNNITNDQDLTYTEEKNIIPYDSNTGDLTRLVIE